MCLNLVCGPGGKSILKVAESFKGGGHHLAAGATICNQNLKEIKAKALKRLLQVTK